MGHSTDRRTLAHIGEVFREDNIKCLMCFICGCKHMYHHGFDKFGRSRSKGETDYRTDSSQHLRRVLVGTAEENSAWSYNSSRKRFDDHFGDAVKTDIHYATETGEWNRKVIRGGKEHDLLCNPEDVRRTSACKHDDRTVCTKCQISIGNEYKIGNIESSFNNKLMKICTSLWMYMHILWICKLMHVLFFFDLLCVITRLSFRNMSLV